MLHNLNQFHVAAASPVSGTSASPIIETPSELNPPGEPAFNEVLINTVRDYPALYSTSRRPYDGVDRQVIWTEVAGRIGRNVSPEFAKKRWLQLRDRYRKELKIAIAQNFTQPQKWNHFALLKWLDPHLQGSVPIAGADHLLENSSSMSYLDGLLKNQSPYNDFTHFEPRFKDEMMESADSDDLEDVKPLLSTLQSVLAATEQKIANENSRNEQIDNIFDYESSSGSIVDEVVPTVCAVSPPSDASSVDCHPVISNLFSEDIKRITLEQITGMEADDSNESVVIRASPSLSSNDTDQSPAQDRVHLRSAPGPIRSQLSLSAHPYRFKARNLNNYKYRSSISPSKPGAMQSTRPTATPVSSGAQGASSAPSPMEDWFNNEELLFARIVGLRLQKMDPSRRKVVRSQIMNLLDEETDQDIAEAGASVAE